MLDRLYGDHTGYEPFLDDLKWLDMKRSLEPDWFQRPDMVGYVFYIDRFAGDLSGVLNNFDYLEEIGTNYVHFMPA